MEMHYCAKPNIFKRAEELRKNQTQAESLLWEHLSKSQLGVKIRRQHPLKFFVADFYCHSAKLIIELDGGIHERPDQKEYDINREYELKDLGIHVIRFTNDEVLNELNSVIEKIKSHLNLPCP